MTGRDPPGKPGRRPPRRGLRLRPALLAAATILVLSAHVGTNDVFFAGEAGPWPVRVTVRQPGVIPGLADITVRVEAPGVEAVRVTALRRIDDRGEAPPPDVAVPVPGADGLYAAQLWLMTRGAHSVIVTVEGTRGGGTATVPVMAVATRTLEMTRALEALLLAGGLFLVVGLLTLVRAAARESVLEPGREPGTRERRRSRWAVAAAAVVVAAGLLGGWTWVRAEDALYRERVDRPWDVEVRWIPGATGPVLRLAITDSLWIMRDDPDWLARNGRYRRPDLIPDHGKLMHMFLVREEGMDAFAHVHPVRVDANTFDLATPPLPAGRYRVYADLVHEDGSDRTLVTGVTVPPAGKAEVGPEAGERPEIDSDDAWWAGRASTDGRTVLDDGAVMEWVEGPDGLVEGRDTEIGIRVTDPGGAPAALEPYMGMRGHAMLNRSDGEVFVHLHPVGMISMAAQQALERQAGGGGSSAHRGMPGKDGGHGGTAQVGEVRFPLLAPPAGTYRVWIQVKREGRVLTGAFDARVRPGGPEG